MFRRREKSFVPTRIRALYLPTRSLVAMTNMSSRIPKDGVIDEMYIVQVFKGSGLV